jgi:hypothetical protein
MSAIPEDFIRKTSQLSEAVTRPFPNARKVYVTGSRPGHPGADARGQPVSDRGQLRRRGEPADHGL